MKKLSFLAMWVALLICSSCGKTDQIAYFQDVVAGEQSRVVNATEIKIKPNDKISIVVSCKDPQLSALYNLPIMSYRVGQAPTAGVYSGGNNQVANYTVDGDGNIDFPVLGTLHVAGMNRAEIAEMVKKKLSQTDGGLKDPTIIVEFINLNISVLGEVKSQGVYAIDRDEYTILDAISRAGDLTIYGRRDNVKIIRSNDGKRKVYEVNLCNAESVYTSPAFYLQQNDIVYVEPNKVRARQSTANGNNFISTSFWVSVSSVLMSLVLLVKNW